MAIVKKGSPLEGLRGRVGDLVFRVRGDQTIVSSRPSRRRKGPTTPARQRTLTRFQEAVRFAREARHRNAYRSLSRTRRGYSPYHVALQDYLSVPAIEAVEVLEGRLTIRVAERVAVRSVRVRLSPDEGEQPPPEPPHPEPEAKPKPVSTPAQIFFRRGGTEPGTRPAPPVPPASPVSRGSPASPVSRVPPEPRPADEASPEPNGGAEPAGTGYGELRAVRVSEAAPKGGAARFELWQVVLPRTGTAEIIAADYAGNRATGTYHVGVSRVVPLDPDPGPSGAAPLDADPQA